MRILILVPTVFFTFSACDQYTNKTSEIPDGLFIEIYVDVVQTSLDSTQTDTNNIFDMILKNHNLTREEWDRTVELYQRDPAVWLDIFSDIQQQLQDTSKTSLPKKRTLFQ